MSGFFTQRDEVKNLFEPKNSGQKIVETAGYVPAKQMIESMIDAGRNFEEFRRTHQGYDTDEDAFDNYDPTSDTDFDMSDAKKMSDDLADKFVSAEREKSKKKPDSPETSPDQNPEEKEVIQEKEV